MKLFFSNGFLENAEEGVFFFYKRWQVAKRPDFFSLIFPVKSDRFFVRNSGPIQEISLIWTLFGRFLPFAHVSYKKTYSVTKRDDVKNGRRSVFGAF